MFSKRNKVIVLSAMMVLLVATGILNVVLNNRVVDMGAGQQITTADYFVTYRADRLNMRNQQIAYYDAIINNPNVTTAQRDLALSEKNNIIRLMDVKNAAEGLIRAIGFSDAVVSTSNGESFTVVLQTSNILTSAEIAQIVTVMQTQVPGLSVANIRIMPIN